TGAGVAAAGLDLSLHDSEHPAGADEGGEGAIDEGLAPAPVPCRLVSGEAVLGSLGELEKAGLELVVAFDVELAVGRVVALVKLVDDRVPHEAGVVEPRLAGRVEVLLAEVEVLLPGGVLAAEELCDSLAVTRHAGSLEERSVVAE